MTPTNKSEEHDKYNCEVCEDVMREEPPVDIMSADKGEEEIIDDLWARWGNGDGTMEQIGFSGAFSEAHSKWKESLVEEIKQKHSAGLLCRTCGKYHLDELLTLINSK